MALFNAGSMVSGSGPISTTRLFPPSPVCAACPSSLAAGFVLSDLLTNLERVADHCSNIAGCLLDMKNERIDLHKYLDDVKNGSNDFLMQYNAFEEKYKLA